MVFSPKSERDGKPERPSLTELQARTDTFCFGSRGGGQERHVTVRMPAPAHLKRLGAMQAEAVVLLDDVQCQELDAFLVERIYEFNSNATRN